MTDKRNRYPPFPGSNWDYGLKMAAAAQLRKPNKSICIYCRAQAPTDAQIQHAGDCPAKPGEQHEGSGR